MAATSPITGTLSADLRQVTQPVHDQLNRSSYVAALLDGVLPLDGYTLLAEQYVAIYTALEAAGDALAGDPLAGPFVIDGLRRVPALHADLDALGGGVPRVLPATTAYVQRLREVAADPALFVAHHYTRYLGDLAGGQVIGKVLGRTYGIEGPGRLFYDFSELGSPPRFRTHYRALLDDTPWTLVERERLLAEAVRAFELNHAMFEQMAEEVGLAQPLAS
ncbi:heme oxygenase (biliverdin-producing) [Pseudonocardia sp. HH130629-09]|uniref:biliverdin-producing heme oxygenase n=1 Tax=Pseudonocardia sp. HH130629-09 TaxID=1641402 RepID=UPI0006CB64FC|nr:biliverdin-producing heme oxygenase [Pseudonocardia sp. HH130629-09]ALE83851.1 heme oxygenase [Pseudonocardia sp. HH130629-09]